MAVSSPSPVASVAPAQKIPNNARAVDGDYLKPGAGRSTVKDADGDYKATPAQSTATGPVQAAVTDIKLGG